MKQVIENVRIDFEVALNGRDEPRAYAIAEMVARAIEAWEMRLKT